MLKFLIHSYLIIRFVEYTIASPFIKDFTPDGIVTIDQECRRENSESWGLARISHRNNGQTTHEYVLDGTGVNAYIIDTGIYLEHNDFNGRAVWGKTFTGDNNDKDCNGHGTHVAGIVGSTTYGVAKNVQLIAVKVLNCAGSGTFSGIIEGVQWVAEQHKLRGKPSVANMSLGGSLNRLLDEAVEAMIKQGVSTSVSAGNSNMDACNHSVRTDYAITTGSSTENDERSSFSNYGPCVDVFSPGSDIISTYIGAPDNTRSLSGTSMASPHSCGLAARILSENPTLTPLEVKKIVVDNATRGVLNLKCTNSICEQSPNLLAYGGCQ